MSEASAAADDDDFVSQLEQLSVQDNNSDDKKVNEDGNVVVTGVDFHGSIAKSR